MNELDRLHKAAKQQYDRGGSPTSQLRDVVVHALGLLSRGATTRFLATCDNKLYSVFQAGQLTTRPYLPALFEADQGHFERGWADVLAAASPLEHRFGLDPHATNAVLYTAVGAFALCYDLWRPGSRKTPGTFFEVLLGTLLQLVLPHHRRAGHVLLPGQTENVSTDIVFHRPGAEAGGLVIPAKITTRERVVQPYAHQRILDSIFGEDAFKSTLVCMSEMQRDGDGNAKAICVPGTIRLFQMHLSRLSGIYYLDPPARYLDHDVVTIVPVRSVGALLARDLPALVG